MSSRTRGFKNNLKGPRFRGGGGNIGNTFRNFASGLSGTTSASSTASGSFDTVDTFIRNEVVGTPDEEFMRSRNVEFNASNLKPNTRFYQFLDGNSAVDLVPKLIEISDNQGLTGNGSSGAFRHLPPLSSDKEYRYICHLWISNPRQVGC